MSPEIYSNVSKRWYWARVGLGVRAGMIVHRLSGHMDRERENRKKPWGNVPGHCLVEVARVRVPARWVGLSRGIIEDMSLAAFLHDADKKPEIEATRSALARGESPLSAVNAQSEESARILRNLGFSDRVIRFAFSAGGLAPELLETERILKGSELGENDWGYLLCHYVDDISVGDKWVGDIFRRQMVDGRDENIIDFRARENKSKSAYSRISEEVGKELAGHSVFGGINNHDAMSIVSHEIERRLVPFVFRAYGRVVDPLDIPELIDGEIRDQIFNYSLSRMSLR